MTDEAREVLDLTIEPGTTASDVLQAAKLNHREFQLQCQRGEQFESPSGADNVYRQAHSGEEFFAMPKSIVVG